MKLDALAPVLWVENIEKTVTFYQNILGFTCMSQTEGWACLSKDGIELMISLPNQHEPFNRLQFTGSFYFRTEDVDEA